MRDYILETSFRDKADCISQTFEKANIVDLVSLQNAPRKLGHICGEDIYQIVAELNEVFERGLSKPSRKKKPVEIIEENASEEEKAV